MNKVNLEGRRFGRLFVLDISKQIDEVTWWLCRCDCGKIKKIRYSSLTSKTSKSCGCLQKEITSKRSLGNKYGIRHGKSHTSIHNTWLGMKQRCTNRKNKKYKDYGARGIKVCKRWEKFENFFKDMGKSPSPKHSIDRINNDDNYTPSNCRWATAKQQANNRRY